MKRRMVVVLAFVFVASVTAQAGLFKDSVDLADLSEASAESLLTLKETEFAVFLAQVQLNTAKAAERRAGGAVKAAERMLEVENLDLKAAEAELKAAKANQDSERMTVAGARIVGAKEDLAAGKAFLLWKQQEVEARRAEVAAAKSALDLKEAERDAARVRLLSQERAPSASKYEVAGFDRNVDKRRKEHTAATRKAADRTAKLDSLKTEWQRLAKGVEPVVTD